MKYIKSFNESKLSPHVTSDLPFYMNTKKTGDTIKVEGKEVILVSTIKWSNSERPVCLSFEADDNGNKCIVNYDDGFDAYVFDRKIN